MVFFHCNIGHANHLSSTQINHEYLQFELDCRRKAQERQAATLARGTPQVAGGRTFTGAMAFMPKPAVVLFKDFDVGKTYHRRFTLTNVSLTFNAFKVCVCNKAS